MKKRLLNFDKRVYGVFAYPPAILRSPSWPVVMVTEAHVPDGGGFWCQREQFGPCYQRIVAVHFDMSGGSLRDWLRSLPLFCPFGIFSGLEWPPGQHLSKALKDIILLTSTWGKGWGIRQAAD